MEKYTVPLSPSQNPKNPNRISRSQWKRTVPELSGRISSKYRHEDSQLLLESYSEVRAFEHSYRIGSDKCPTYIARMSNIVNHDDPDYFLREGITGLEFDSKGVYLASVTKSGCLTVHDFETLYCLTYGPSSSSLEDETKHLLHIAAPQTLDAVRWNPTNQDEVVFGASKQGIIYAWDLRGGRTSLAFQSLNEVYYPPLVSLKVSSMLEKITSLKAQSNIMSREIHSVSFDPSCSYQLAFHLDDGWSGILNIDSLNVTHMHCPPPAWLDGMEISSASSSLRKSAWLPACSVFAVGSSSGKGIYLLDFFPHRSSACHVDFNEDLESISNESKETARNKFCTVSECVLVCAAHPINGTIIAGTKHSSLLVISQRHQDHKDLDCTP